MIAAGGVEDQRTPETMPAAPAPDLSNGPPCWRNLSIVRHSRKPGGKDHSASPREDDMPMQVL